MITNKLKELINKNENQPNKKKIENLVVFLIILIITIIAINSIWNGQKESNTEQHTTDKNKKLALTQEETIQANSNTTEEEIVVNLEEILSKIKGVGKVKVMITYSKTSQTVPLYNEDLTQRDTEETDKQGGNRKITEKDTKKEIIYKEENGEKVPITQSIISPQIEGAIITAQGANNIDIKTSIIQAVEAVTGIATHKIQVFEMSE